MLPLLISLSLGSWGAEIPVERPPAVVLRAPNSSPWFATATSWDDSFLLAWQDVRFANVPVIMIARADPDANGPNGVELTPLEPLADVAFDAFPAIAVADGVVWATYARADFGGNNMRVYVRTWQRQTIGSSCTAGWMCQSNLCEASACQMPPPPPDAGTEDAGTVNDAGVIILPDGGVVLPDGGTPPPLGKRQLSVGSSCSSSDASVMALLSALLAWRSRRKNR